MDKKILVVDDDEPTVQTLSSILSNMGYSVGIARNGQEVLENLEKSIPDLMLLDIMMPRMDGLKLIQVLKRSMRGANIKIIVITALLLSNLVMELSKLGVELCIRKPVDVRKLAEIIKREIG